MPISDEQLAAKGRAAFERIIASARKSAVTGYPRGDGTSYIRTDPDGNTLSQNQVYVRADEIFNGQPFPAWNTATAARAEQPVFIEKIRGRWEVTGLDSAKAEAVYGAAASELGSPDKFGATPNLTHSRDLIELRPRVWIPGTLKLNVEAGFYTDSAGNKAYWQPSNVNVVDAVADVPAASGGINQWQWEVLALNPDATTPVLALFHSTAQYVTLPLLPSQIASITITAGYKPIAAFILQTGDTTEANLAENDWVDLRLWLMSGGAGGSASPLMTKGDLYGYSTVGARVPIGTDGQNLVADSTQALGLKWATPTAGINKDVFAQTASVTVASTASETTLVGAGQGSVTLAAAYLSVVGRSMVIRASGFLSDTGATPTLTLRFKYGTTTLCATVAVGTPGTDSNAAWTLEATFTVRTTGASGTVFAQGWLTYANVVYPMLTTATVTIDTTTSTALNLTAQWSASASSNTITCTDLAVQMADPNVAAGASSVSVLLNYAAATDIISGTSITANIWTDVGTNQSFTVTDSSKIITISVGGCVHMGGSAAANIASRIVIDSAGTPINKFLGGSYAPTATTYGNPLSGSSTVQITGLTAGVHTVKLQVYTGSTNFAYCRASSLPDLEGLTFLVMQS